MSADEPLPSRTPENRWPVEIPRHIPPKLDRKTLQRIRDRLEALPCQN